MVDVLRRGERVSVPLKGRGSYGAVWRVFTLQIDVRLDRMCSESETEIKLDGDSAQAIHHRSRKRSEQ